jgi:hypothetical protein
MTWQRFGSLSWKQFKDQYHNAPLAIEEVAQGAKRLTTKSREALRRRAEEYLQALAAFEDALEEAGIQLG